jgi:hypothetical protein
MTGCRLARLPGFAVGIPAQEPNAVVPLGRPASPLQFASGPAKAPERKNRSSPAMPCLEHRCISGRSPIAGRVEPSGWVIDCFPRKFATVVVNAPAISARRSYRVHFAAAH